MPHTRPSLLIVDDDRDLVSLLADAATARRYRTVTATSLAEALSHVAEQPADVALVDLALGADSGLEVIATLKASAPDSEIVVISGTASLASAIRSYDLAAFAFVQKPFDVDQLFATVERAIERRRMNLDNRRLVWELQTINEMADGLSRSLELDDVLTGALQRLVCAMDGAGGSVRLFDDRTGKYEDRASVGFKMVQGTWNAMGAELPRPSEQVIATRQAVLVEDLADLIGEAAASVPVRSVISVPLFAGDELLGTLTVGSANPRRFSIADQHLLTTLAGQIVVAIQNTRLHRSVRRGKREWEQTFDAISDPIAVFDAGGELLRGNAALAAHLGRPIRSLPGTSCRAVGFCGGNCPDCAVNRALAQDVGGRAEITLPDGQIFSVTTFPVANVSAGASVVQVAKNVTEEIRSARRLRQMSEELAIANARLMAAVDQLKSTQAQLLQAEKLSAIGQLVAGVAHELNNPLTSVIGYAQLLEEELRGDAVAPEMRPREELAHDVRRIAEESERAARIVRNLLAFARRQSAARVPQDVAELGARVLALRAYELRLNGVELTTEFQNDLPDVVADGGQLQQALLNLVLNAEQAMRGRPARRLTVGARFDEAAGAVELFVSDSGHGIDPSNLSRIFDPFFTTRAVGEGTGLGLSICYGIIRDHGGHIRVDSKVQVGTTFSMLLPARIEDPAIAGDEILVAHADQGDREFMTAALAAWGYRAAASATLDEALQRYRRGGLAAVLVDRALLAADLPQWRSVRRAGARRVPLVLLSAAPGDGEVDQFGREEASAVLAPPYELRALRSAVRAVAQECV
jgi:two-component system NtrC family sensor kinase